MAAQETPTSTRAPVDVLAVMDRAIESAGLMIKASGDLRAVAYQDDLFKARAAVAELIEALSAERAVGHRKYSDLAEARKRTEAALAHVKGGA